MFYSMKDYRTFVSTCVRSDVNLECTVAVETFTTVATSVLVVVPVAMTTCDASYCITGFAHCQQTQFYMHCTLIYAAAQTTILL